MCDSGISIGLQQPERQRFQWSSIASDGKVSIWKRVDYTYPRSFRKSIRVA
jgi:predicted Fe-S protein YdhL (DUF1289 family)